MLATIGQLLSFLRERVHAGRDHQATTSRWYHGNRGSDLIQQIKITLNSRTKAEGGLRLKEFHQRLNELQLAIRRWSPLHPQRPKITKIRRDLTPQLQNNRTIRSLLLHRKDPTAVQDRPHHKVIKMSHKTIKSDILIHIDREILHLTYIIMINEEKWSKRGTSN